MELLIHNFEIVSISNMPLPIDISSSGTGLGVLILIKLTNKLKESLISIGILISVLFVAFLILYLSYFFIRLVNQELECLNISEAYILVINYILLLVILCIFVYTPDRIIKLLSKAIENYALWSTPGYYRVADRKPATYMFSNIIIFLSNSFKLLIYILCFILYLLSVIDKYKQMYIDDPIVIVMNDAILTFVVLDGTVRAIKNHWTNRSETIFDFLLIKNNNK